MQIYRLGEVNLCFTYLHGNVKAKVYPWVYEVFSNAIITPPHPSMPATHACPECTELRAVPPTMLRKHKLSALPACLGGLWGAAGCHSATLARALQGWGRCAQWPMSSAAAATGSRGRAQCWAPPLPTRTAAKPWAAQEWFTFPAGAKLSECGRSLLCLFSLTCVSRRPDSQSHPQLINNYCLIQQRLLKHLYEWICSNIFYLVSNWTHKMHVIAVTQHQGLHTLNAKQWK